MWSKVVSVITPTCGRVDSLLNVCIPSVKTQTYPSALIEHIVVSDGKSDGLAESVHGVADQFIELGRRWGGFVNCHGAVARNVGIATCTGDYIAYLDDDDAFLPEHIEKLVGLMENRQVDFVFSQMQRYVNGVPEQLIGDGIVAPNHIGTPMVLHKAECLRAGFWPLAGYLEDANFFMQFVEHGFKYAFLPDVTISVYRYL